MRKAHFEASEAASPRLSSTFHATFTKSRDLHSHVRSTLTGSSLQCRSDITTSPVTNLRCLLRVYFEPHVPIPLFRTNGGPQIIARRPPRVSWMHNTSPG